MRDKIKDFLVKLNYLFPLEGKRIETVFETYTDILLEHCLRKEYDFKKLLSRSVQEWKLTRYPTVKFIIEQLPYAEVVRYYSPAPDEGSLIVLKLPNGFAYTFTATNYAKSLKELMADCTKRYGECEIKIYPKGTIMIGNKKIIEP